MLVIDFIGKEMAICHWLLQWQDISHTISFAVISPFMIFFPQGSLFWICLPLLSMSLLTAGHEGAQRLPSWLQLSLMCRSKLVPPLGKWMATARCHHISILELGHCWEQDVEVARPRAGQSDSFHLHLVLPCLRRVRNSSPWSEELSNSDVLNHCN